VTNTCLRQSFSKVKVARLQPSHGVSLDLALRPSGKLCLERSEAASGEAAEIWTGWDSIASER